MALSAYYGVARTTAGTIIISAAVEVRRAADNSLATIFADEAGTTPINNGVDFVTGSDGTFLFYAEPDRYNVLVGSGASQVTVPADIVDGRAQVPWPSRAQAVTDIAGGFVAPDGTVKSDGNVLYIASSGATDIADMPGWLPFGDRWYVDHFGGNTAPGVTDLASALSLAINTGRDIYLLATSYRFERASGFWTLTGQSIIGAGLGRTSVTFASTTDSFQNFFRCEEGSGISDLDITIEGAGTEIIDFISPRGDNGYLRRVRVDGGMTGSNWTSNIFHLADTADASGWEISSCLFENHGWSFLKDNTDTSANNRWVVRDSTFRNMYRPATINSPSGDAIGWIFTGNTFDTNLNASGFGHLSGCAGGTGFQFVGNTFLGVCDEALHFEESDQTLVSSNYISVEGGSGVWFVENSVGGVQKSNNGIVITGNTIFGDGTSGKHGIWCIVNNFTNPSAEAYVIVGNSVSGFDRGISTGIFSYSGIVSGNTVSNSTYGIYSVEPRKTIRDNVIVDCETAIYGSDRGGTFGPHVITGATTIMDAAAQYIIAEEITIELPNFTIPNGVQQITVCPQFSRMLASGRVEITTEEGANRWGQYPLSKTTGASMPASTTADITAGSGALTLTGFSESSGNLVVDVNNTSGADLTQVRATVTISGMIGN